MHAVRNIKLCTKDCLCLYVCPTGATNTETGQIDAAKCISGCRLCADACPSHAISLVPDTYPPQQEKKENVTGALLSLSLSKTRQEKIAEGLAQSADSPAARQLAKALGMSNLIMAEDILRESGYMLPQSENVRDLLNKLLNTPQPEDFPAEACKKLLTLLEKNDKSDRSEYNRSIKNQ